MSTSEEDARFYYLIKQASILNDQGNEFGDNPALIEAIEAYRCILQEYTRERVPLDWAMTQANIGLAYRAIAEKTRDGGVLHQSIERIQAAIEVFDESQASYMIEVANGMLTSSETLLAELKGEDTPK